jgi:hypothetical protein
VIATAATFATTTPYTVVPAGDWTLELGPSAGGAATRSTVDLAPGAVYSVIVLDAKSGGLQVVSRLDARGTPVTPAGSVATGFGGTADRGWPVVPLVALVLLVAGLVGWRRYSREAPCES